MKKNALKNLEDLSFKARILSPSEHLCRQGDNLQSLFIIRSGLLKSYSIKENGDEFIMGFHFPAQILGWEIFNEGKSKISICAVEESNVCEIPLEQFKALIKSEPEIEWKIFELISKQIQAANEVLLRTSAEQRVAHFLMDLSKQHILQKSPSHVCKTSMTHHDMANYLHIAPETISRIFRRLQNNKIIKVNKKEIMIYDFEKLQNLETE
jgi:CRP/FNR family transcriptional regulator